MLKKTEKTKIKKDKSFKNRKYRMFICHCGNNVWKRIDDPVYINSSCGCTRYDYFKTNPPAKTHGLSKSLIYFVWSNLKNRCDNPKYRLYKDYGGRGISYDKSWSDFNLFYKDMGDSYKKGLHIDRIDNNGDYCKENCRWVHRIINNNNKRNNTKLTLNGKTMNLAQWSRELGIKQSTICQRIYSYGWSIKKALTTKVNKKHVIK